MPEPSPISLDLRRKSRDELLDLKLRFETEIVSIRTQISRAKAEARSKKVFTAPEWWYKAHQALRIKGRQCQQVQLELSRARARRITSLEKAFLEAARERLDPELFSNLIEAAKQRAG